MSYISERVFLPWEELDTVIFWWRVLSRESIHFAEHSLLLLQERAKSSRALSSLCGRPCSFLDVVTREIESDGD